MVHLEPPPKASRGSSEERLPLSSQACKRREPRAAGCHRRHCTFCVIKCEPCYPSGKQVVIPQSSAGPHLVQDTTSSRDPLHPPLSHPSKGLQPPRAAAAPVKPQRQRVQRLELLAVSDAAESQGRAAHQTVNGNALVAHPLSVTTTGPAELKSCAMQLGAV